MPSLDATAYVLANISADITSLRSTRLLDTLDASLGTTETAIAELRAAFVGVNVSISALGANLDMIPLSSLATSLLAFNNSISHCPSLGPIFLLLNSIEALGGAVICLGNLVHYANALNASFLALPHTLATINDAFSSANNSFAPLENQLALFNATVANLEAAVSASPDFSYIASVSCLRV